MGGTMNLKFFKLLTLLSPMLTACGPLINLPLVDALEVREISSYQVIDWTKGLVSPSIDQANEILRPPSAWVPLLEFKRYNELGQSSDCLIYRTPYKKQLGKLKLISLAANDSCSQLVDPNGALAVAEIDEIDSLKAALNLKDSSFALEWRHQGNLFRHQFRFLNSVPKNGMLVLTADNAFPSGNLLGKLTDRYGDQSAVICHQVDENCIGLSENTCDRCRYGWYSTANTHCPQGATKICGINRCGEVGEPACPRGIDYRIYKIDYTCIDDSPAAFCQQGLRVVCDGKKNLICQ